MVEWSDFLVALADLCARWAWLAWRATKLEPLSRLEIFTSIFSEDPKTKVNSKKQFL
jgi:hypothetical protein